MYEKLRFNLRKYMYISGAGGTGVKGAVPIQILADQLTLCQIMPTKLILVPTPRPLRIFKPSAGSDHAYRMKKKKKSTVAVWTQKTILSTIVAPPGVSKNHIFLQIKLFSFCAKITPKL